MLATLLQKSHRVPRPPSHVYAFTTSNAFCKPGWVNCVMFGAEAAKLVAEYAVPPLSFRFSW